MREFLKEKGIEPDLINEIMAEHGKKIGADKLLIEQLEKKVDETTREANTYKNAMDELEKDFLTAKDSQTELEELKTSIAEQEAQRKEAEETEKFETDLNAILGERKFINDYTRQAVINEFKTALEGKEDANKEDVFNELTKDREDLFSNPNKVDLPKIEEVDQEVNKTNIPLMW